jgi:hypothetical protein
MSNLQRFEFAELGIDIEAETQSINLRFFEHATTEIIGVCSVEAAGIGQATVKLLFIDSAKREYVKPIHAALNKLSADFGFSQKLYQRKKAGKFITFFKTILPKLTRGKNG